MKKVLMVAVLMMSSSAFGLSSMNGNWCELTYSQSAHKFVRTTDFTVVLSIENGGDFVMGLVGNETGYAGQESIVKGYIGQGASGGAYMETDSDFGAKLEEVDFDSKGNLQLNFTDGSENHYSPCESPKFEKALRNAFQ